jgi:hypothetical protein
VKTVPAHPSNQASGAIDATSAPAPQLREHVLYMRVYGVRRDGTRYELPGNATAHISPCPVDGCTCEGKGP